MLPTRTDTAILLFSRSAVGESVAKPLVFKAHAGRNQAVAALLIRYARRMATHSGMPVFIVSEYQQHGSTFGERFADAFRQIFERGYERVIAIGNDCPALVAADLRAAAQKLDQTSTVFGPASDGGAYLVALRQDAFDPAAFAALDWQTDHTRTDLEAYSRGDFFLLPEKADVDSAADLQYQLRSQTFPILLKIRLLILLMPIGLGYFVRPVFVPKTALSSGFALRGPPM